MHMHKEAKFGMFIH